jgi:hypothetical protein
VQARELLEPVFDALAADAVTTVIRETVEAVKAGEEISETELGRRLQVAKSTIAYRVNRALEGGWLLNRETRKGHAARLVRGADLPETVSALPTAAQIRRVFDRTKGSRMDDPPASPPRQHGAADAPISESMDGDRLQVTDGDDRARWEAVRRASRTDGPHLDNLSR